MPRAGAGRAYPLRPTGPAHGGVRGYYPGIKATHCDDRRRVTFPADLAPRSAVVIDTVIGATVNLAARLESVDLTDRGMPRPNGSFRLLVNEET